MNKSFGIACLFSVLIQVVFLSIIEKGIVSGLLKLRSFTDAVMIVKFVTMIDPFIIAVIIFFIASLFYKIRLASFISLTIITMFGFAFTYIAILALYT